MSNASRFRVLAIGYIILFCIYGVGLLNPSISLAGGHDQRDSRKGHMRSRFSFALIGDLPYNAEQKEKFYNLIDDINSEEQAFVVHDGDFKSGSSLCSDELFYQRYNLFNTFAAPFIFVFGDNEWTDCHRIKAGAYDPVERLELLRRIFTQGDQSLGQQTLRLTRQSVDPLYARFRENVRWIYGDVMFVGLDIVGSNNNLGRTPEADAEYFERNAANLAWISQSFELAEERGIRGVMLIIQADPRFDLSPSDSRRSGFNDFLKLLEEETVEFDAPVVLVHGDSHYFRIDKPMINSQTGRRVENFTRVETFGSPDVHWVRAIVDFRDPNIFSFKQQIVESNLVPQP